MVCLLFFLLLSLLLAVPFPSSSFLRTRCEEVSFCRFAEILLCEPFEGSGCNNRHKLARTKGLYISITHRTYTHRTHASHHFGRILPGTADRHHGPAGKPANPARSHRTMPGPDEYRKKDRNTGGTVLSGTERMILTLLGVNGESEQRE